MAGYLVQLALAAAHEEIGISKSPQGKPHNE